MRRGSTLSNSGIMATSTAMEAAGIDIIPDKKNKSASKREKRGECPTCGTQTHKLSRLGTKRTPLTREGVVRKGHCLRCKPLEGYIRRSHPLPGVGVAGGSGRSPQLPQPPPFYQPSAPGPHGGPSQPQTHPYLVVQQQQNFQQLPPHQYPAPVHHQHSPQHHQHPPPASPMMNSPQHQQVVLERQQQQQQQQQLMHPPEQFHNVPESGIAIPRTLEVSGMDDDMSVLTMDHRLAQGAQNWAHSGGIIYDSDADEDAPPPNSRRPGPESGDFDNNPADTMRMMRPPARTLMPHSNPTGAGSRRNIESGAPLGAGGSYRRKHPPLPPTQEHISPRQLPPPSQSSNGYRNSSNRELQQEAALQRGPNSQARKEYLLPPGGMDSLLRNRAGETGTLPQQQLKRKSSKSGEIRFEPLPLESPSHTSPPLLTTATTTTTTVEGVAPRAGALMPPGMHRKVFSNQPPQNSAEFSPPQPLAAVPTPDPHSRPPAHISNPRRTASVSSGTSGPMYQSDDFPTYLGQRQATEGAAETQLMTQVSGPSVMLPSPSHSIQTVGPSVLAASGGVRQSYASSNAGTASQEWNAAEALSGDGQQRFDSKYSNESESQSTYAPPLVNRDLRGRPDDTSIHDPFNIMMIGNGGGVNLPQQPIGGLLDDDDAEQTTEEDAAAAAIHVTTMQGMVSGHVQVGSKPPPAGYAPDISPLVDRPSKSIRSSLDSLEPPYGPAPPPMGDSRPQQSSSHQFGGIGAAAHPSLRNQTHSSHYVSAAAPVAMPEIMPSSPVAAGGGTPSNDRMTDMIRKLSLEEDRNGRTPKQQREAMLDDVPVILHCLNLPQANTHMRKTGLRQLAVLLSKPTEKAREFVLQNQGIDTLVKAMWEDIGNSQVQDAAADVLLAVATSSDAKASSDMLANQDSFCDALLFSMQMHAKVASIQLKGCCIFSCLAAASSNNNRVSDGTLSGALMMELTAMNNHNRAVDIQKAGLQALYYQCALSSNAESNQRSFLESNLDTGATGMDVLVNAMQVLRKDLVAQEWVCRIFWSLTVNDELVKKIPGVAVVIQEVMQTCKHRMPDFEALSVVEPCIAIIGNLASSSTLRDNILQAGGMEIVIRVMQTYVDQPQIVGEAVRAMVCLAIHSQETKDATAVPEVISWVIQAGINHQGDALVQEMCCSLLASLAVGRATSDIIIDNGGLDLIILALKSLPDEEAVQDAACSAYRNLCCQVQETDSLRQKGAVKAIVKAMLNHEKCVSIQRNACYSIWNLASKTERDPGSIVESLGVKAIIKAMQNHMESAELLEIACGALWSLVDTSIDRKKDVVGNGAIDAVVCTLVMHPTTTSTLIKACGVFSNVSYEGQLAEAIARAQGVSVVVDVMRNNGAAVALLETGCITLRNIIYNCPGYAQEASMAISTVIDAMRENVDVISFQQEACNFLWVLASEAESCQSKILALDGISVLMKCLEHNSYDPNVQEAALGAFNQLAANG